MENQTISREAADKTKGFRLQKIRAIKLMLESIENNDNAYFYTAIEVIEDISHTTESADSSEEYFEEDKNYNISSNFTIFSDEVKNTLVSFFDIYVNKWKLSEEINLGFYTTSGIGKERKTKLDCGQKITLPKKPVLECLSDNDLITDDIVLIVKAVVMEEYSKQYKDKKVDGHIQKLRTISLEDFKSFLKKIKWNFGEEDDIQLKSTVISLIKNSRLHNTRVVNKEEFIFSMLMEKIDEKQNLKNHTARFVHSAEVKLVFKEAESEEADHSTDPTWVDIQALENEIDDKRNLSEKILAVCPDYSPRKLGHLARIASRAKTEQLAGNKSYLSLKYRTFEACSQYFFDNDYPCASSSSEVDGIIKDLNQVSAEHIAELKKDYDYTISNQKVIDGVVMDLFDSCFIAFDEK